MTLDQFKSLSIQEQIEALSQVECVGVPYTSQVTIDQQLINQLTDAIKQGKCCCCGADGQNADPSQMSEEQLRQWAINYLSRITGSPTGIDSLSAEQIAIAVASFRAAYGYGNKLDQADILPFLLMTDKSVLLKSANWTPAQRDYIIALIDSLNLKVHGVLDGVTLLTDEQSEWLSLAMRKWPIETLREEVGS